MNRTLLICILIWLSACSTQPGKIVNHYVLNSVESSHATPERLTAPMQLVGIDVTLSDYLMQSNLAMQLQSHQLYYSKQHLWAEPLQVGIEKALLSDLNATASKTAFVSASSHRTKQQDMRVGIAVEHFVATHDGKVIVAGNYWLLKSDDTLAMPRQLVYFSFEKALEQDGYPHAVAQLRLLVKALSSDILKSVQEFED